MHEDVCVGAAARRAQKVWSPHADKVLTQKALLQEMSQSMKQNGRMLRDSRSRQMDNDRTPPAEAPPYRMRRSMRFEGALCVQIRS